MDHAIDHAQDLIATADAPSLGARAGALAADVRDRLPELMDAGGRALEQVGEQAPGAIDASIDFIERSPTTTLAVIAGACAGLSVGLFTTRVPRLLAIVVGGVALVLCGALLGRREGAGEPWE